MLVLFPTQILRAKLASRTARTNDRSIAKAEGNPAQETFASDLLAQVRTRMRRLGLEFRSASAHRAHIDPAGPPPRDSRRRRRRRRR